MSKTFQRIDSPESALQFVMQLVEMVWRRKLLFVAVFGVVIACVATATLIATREYRSQAKLFLRLGRENASVDPLTTAGENKLIGLQPSFEEELNSVMDLLSSKGNISRVVDLLGPNYVIDARVGGDEGKPMLASAAGRVTTPVFAVANDRREGKNGHRRKAGGARGCRKKRDGHGNFKAARRSDSSSTASFDRGRGAEIAHHHG